MALIYFFVFNIDIGYRFRFQTHSLYLVTFTDYVIDIALSIMRIHLM